MTRVALRFVAIAIALAAAIDPAVSIVAASRPRVALVVTGPQSADAGRVRDSIARELGGAYELVPHPVSDAAAAIVIGSQYPDEPLPDSLRVSTVTLPAAAVPVRIVRVTAPREVPPATAIRVDVDLAAQDAAGRSTELRALVAGVHTAAVSHRWGAATERWHASLDVVPVGAPPFVVRLDATTSASATGAAQTVVSDLVVRRRDAPLAVEVFDARPSWASTFVRRALEADPRFRVESLSLDARALSARTAGAVGLSDRRLDAFAAVVVGGLDRLSGNDVAALDRYLRERGGAVVLLPDQRIDSGPLRPLLPELAERLLEQPATLVSAAGATSLRASEMLVATGLPGSEVVARAPGGDGAPVVVSIPRGDGRLLLSGAMDAWRYRAASDAAFDRFWQSAIAGLALATPPLVDVVVTPPIVRPRESADVLVRVRGGDLASVSASADGEPIRLAPSAERGVYRGRVTGSATRSRMAIAVQAEDTSGRVESAAVAVPTLADALRTMPIEPPLALLSASHRGIDVGPDRLTEIAQFIREATAISRVAATRHPMRSAWWFAPFVACLSAEWWLRRRRGLR